MVVNLKYQWLTSSESKILIELDMFKLFLAILLMVSSKTLRKENIQGVVSFKGKNKEFVLLMVFSVF